MTVHQRGEPNAWNPSCMHAIIHGCRKQQSSNSWCPLTLRSLPRAIEMRPADHCGTVERDRYIQFSINSSQSSSSFACPWDRTERSPSPETSLNGCQKNKSHRKLVASPVPELTPERNPPEIPESPEWKCAKCILGAIYLH